MVARYEEVARSLARRIEDATYPVGSRLPPEVDLATTYAVSRATIRSALDSLERLGMVSRRRRVGTRVESARPTTGYVRTVTTMNELVQYSTETRRRVLGRQDVTVDAALAAVLGCAPGSAWVLVTMLRIDDAGLGASRPLCHTDVYLAPDVASVVGDRVSRPDGLIAEVVEQCTGRLTVRVDQRVRACALPCHLAGPLRADAGSPALRVVRRYVERSGAVALVTVSTHPADRFEFTVSMERSDA
ncbi:GntR family transcriptional regulator [Xylanimonas ulmi]|uniref:GntR family transcriptional regulator n=1 Tax=Xylanimonas ulmi TaxID=228973 RepID=A0A4Q7M3J4_9MICO|nr:GntR family transcriptional regulator [Xylanibacterium ulmi]RZS61543.1 GntR family transcriptional regulator [Xylanibacterium ulmi]